MTAARIALVTVAACVTLSRVGGAQQPPIDPTWLSFDAAARTLRFQLLAGLTGRNGGLNFNGFRDGELTLVVPLGWNTEIEFRNLDVLPHSAEVIAPRTPLPLESVDTAIPGALTIKLAAGLPTGGTDTMRFRAQPAGDHVIFCAVPGHGLAGMWIRLRISADASSPALLLTPS